MKANIEGEEEGEDLNEDGGGDGVEDGVRGCLVEEEIMNVEIDEGGDFMRFKEFT